MSDDPRNNKGLPDNVVPFPARKPAPPPVREQPIDLPRLVQAIGVVVDETHDGLVSVGHNTIVLAEMLKEMGNIQDAHSVALNHIITLLESGWALPPGSQTGTRAQPTKEK